MKKNFLLCFFLFSGSVIFAQSLNSITPTSAAAGDILTVTISGQSTSFGQGTSTTITWFNQGSSTIIYPDFITIGSPTSLSAHYSIPQNAVLGLYDVSVYNNYNGYMVIPTGFEITTDPTPPSIVSIQPDTASMGDVVTVTISGQSTHFGQGTSTTSAWLENGTDTMWANYTNVVDSVSITAQFTISTMWYMSGYHNVNVYNSIDQFVSLPNGFEVKTGPYTGLKEDAVSNPVFRVYPLPFTGHLNIAFHTPGTVDEVSLADVSGRVLLKSKPDNRSGTYRLETGHLDLPKGIYFVILRSGDKSYMQKVVR